MRRILSGEAVAAFVADRLGYSLREPCTALGIERDNRIVCGVVFSDFNGCNIEITVVSDTHELTPAFVRRCGRYVFEELGCLRASITTQQDKVADLALRLGATKEGVRQDYFGAGRPAILLGILKEDWKV